MTENKRFMLDDAGELIDLNTHSFIDYGEECCNLLNELAEENEQLKYDNFNLNKSIECLDETVKEQCNKLDWADECDIKWEEGYTKWIGGKEWLKND